MALMNCPECRKEISDKAVSCPGCGYKIVKKKERDINFPRPLIIIAVILLVVCMPLVVSRIVNTKPADVSKEVYKMGISALETTDEWIDGKITSDEIYDRLDIIFKRLDSMELNNRELLIYASIGSVQMCAIDNSIQNAIEARNILATNLGKKER